MLLRLRDRLLWGLAVGGEVVEQVISGGCRAYHSGKLFLWTPTGYAKKKYRDLAKRMVREGYVQKLLVEGQVHYRITGAGRRQLIRVYPALSMISEKWDGFWRVVVFDVPEKKRRARDVLRSELKRLGFGKLQDSTYISPYDFNKAFLDFLQLRGLAGSVLLFEAKQRHLGKPRQLAEKVWQLNELAKRYEKIIDRLTTRFGIKDRLKREEFLKKVCQEYLGILMEEPFLPKDLLPANWPADEAKKYILRAGVVKEE
jgi:phenylacetic acid degradation operon negative regulatory protein